MIKYPVAARSYTPIAWSLMRSRWRRWTLATVWGVVVCYAEIAKVVSHRALLPIIVGGLFYRVGAVLNLLHWPVLWPGIFGPHELFHLFVLAGSLAHYGFILEVVVSFAQEPRETCGRPISEIPQGDRQPQGTDLWSAFPEAASWR